MPSAPGYSGTPLYKKLGLKPGMPVCLLHAPQAYKELLKHDLEVRFTNSVGDAELIQLFAANASIFYKEMEALKPIIKTNPEIIIWVSWYKKSSGIKTDMNEDLIRDYALSTILVDIKVCAVTDQWSGLKLVVRKKNRHVS